MLKWISLGIRIGIGFLVLAIGFGLIGYMFSTREKPSLKPEVFTPLLVKGLVLEPQVLERTWTGYGTARAMKSARVSPQVSGRVLERAQEIEAGHSVSAGEPLFVIDAVDFELAATNAKSSIASIEAQLSGLDVEGDRVMRQIEIAREELAIAERDLARAQDVIGRGAGNDSEIDQWMSAVRRAERTVVGLEQQLDSIPSRRDDLKARASAALTQLQQAQENLARSVVKAPISGVLQSVTLDKGEWAQTGQEAALIVDLSHIELPLRVGIAASGLVKVGDRVELRARMEDDARWNGFVTRIAPEADIQTRSLTVYVEVNQGSDEDHVLRPGQFVMGKIYESKARARLVVPRRTLKNGRVLIAVDSRDETAAVWPLAERIAGTIARGVADQTELGISPGPDLNDALTLREVIERRAGLEVGNQKEALTAQLLDSTTSWLSGAGKTRVHEEIQRSLTRSLAPEVAKWLVEADVSALPVALRGELEAADRLMIVESVDVEVLFTVEQIFESLDGTESQWIVVQARDGKDLAGQVLLMSNLEQLSDGKVVQVDVRSGDAP